MNRAELEIELDLDAGRDVPKSRAMAALALLLPLLLGGSVTAAAGPPPATGPSSASGVVHMVFDVSGTHNLPPRCHP